VPARMSASNWLESTHLLEDRTNDERFAHRATCLRKYAIKTELSTRGLGARSSRGANLAERKQKALEERRRLVQRTFQREVQVEVQLAMLLDVALRRTRGQNEGTVASNRESVAC
jgi:hypothetical protein